MIRHLCAWSLVLLAFSPFTAPFATCDLATLLGHHTGHLRTVDRADPADLSGMEAVSVSPLIERTVLDKPLVATPLSVDALITLAASTPDGRAGAITPPGRTRQSPPEYRAQRTVLRL